MLGALLFAVYGVGLAEGLFVLLLCLVWPALGGYVAQQKQRNVTEGVLLGFLGPIGCLIEALLPTKSAP